jgi:hypothetical protein
LTKQEVFEKVLWKLAMYIPTPGQPLRSLDVHLSVLSSLPEEDRFPEQLQSLNEIFQAIMNAANQ